MELANQFFANVSIDDDEFQIAPGNLESIHVIQNVAQKVPTCILRLRDYTGQLSDNGTMPDGTQIRLEFGRSKPEEKPTVLDFSSLSVPKLTQIPGGIMHEIRGMLDVPKYWELATTPYNMSSADAISAIASKCEMTPIVEGTNDKTVWRPNRISNNQFVTNIAQKGWAGDSSIMQFCVSESKVLRYRNLETAIKDTPKATFFTGKEPRNPKGKALAVIDRSFKAYAGVSNLGVNYGAKSTREKQNGQTNEQKEFNVPKGVNWLNMSGRFKEKVAENKVRSIALPPDYDNTSDKWDKGLYQNFRGIASFTNIVYVLVPLASEVELLDVVAYSETNPQTGSEIASISANYFVTGKTRLVHNNYYYEKLELCNQGVTTNPKGRLI